MCGLFGWVGAFRAKERARLAATLATLNVTRGNQSWGAAVQSVGSWVRIRGLGPATHGVDDFARFSAVMGHTRLATHGEVSLDNCHPFPHGKVMLAHNGVVFNALQQPDAAGMKVDSQLLARRVSEGRDIEDLSGYGVVTWADVRKPGRVYLCNIGSGDLSVFSVKGKGDSTRGVVWSSEEKHVRIALESASLSFSEYEIKEGTVYLAQQSGLYKTNRSLSWTTKRYSYNWSSSATGGSGRSRWDGRRLVDVDYDNDPLFSRRKYEDKGTFLSDHAAGKDDSFSGNDEQKLQEWLLARQLERQEEERADLAKAGLSKEDLEVLENDAAFWENLE